MVEQAEVSRAAKAWRLSQLGWTQAEIGERLGVSQRQVSDDVRENSQLGKISNDLGEHWNDKRTFEVFPQLFGFETKNRYQQISQIAVARLPDDVRGVPATF
ncbi:MAG: helix-turn-helix domain-containing protein [Planctomycetota bacterium]